VQSQLYSSFNSFKKEGSWQKEQEEEECYEEAEVLLVRGMVMMAIVYSKLDPI
jgi:hypothetical protein